MHLYLHIPFCHRICPYCSFYKHTPGDTRMGEFVESLLQEARFQRERVGGGLRTLYFGGGTPSMLSPTHLRRLFGGLREIFDWEEVGEVTFEANPATFTARTAGLYRDLGVTRVSLGIQSFTEKELRTLGREHTVAQARESVRVLQEAGGLEVNIDLMFSVPGQSLADWRVSLEAARDLAPDHVSAYNLTYEEDTRFFEEFAKGNYRDDEEVNARQYLLAEEILGGAGFEHYETSNYAKAGKRSRHNEAYWAGRDYLGLGPSAVSTVGGRRWRNVADTAAYVRRVAGLGHALDEEEVIGAEEFALERLALMLRTGEGLPREFLG
ncbi:MAG: radical SAM family heme chaperone HemW, partial [Verrucomicrobiales bacterium]